MQNYWPWEGMVRRLWESNKLIGDDKNWVDKMSTKRVFKFSEMERLEALCIKILGAVPEDRDLL